jgi:hypothetical protein
MKLFFQLLLLLAYLQLSSAKSLKLEDVAASMYQKASATATSFFKTAGKPADDYAHPNLRTAEDAVLHDRGTAHLTVYRDPQCTVRDYVLDVKINRCAKYLGNVKLSIFFEFPVGWAMFATQYDDSCENPTGLATPLVFLKDTCAPGPNGEFVKFNIIAHPRKYISGGGGGAFVFYDNYYDCHISKHTNLARAQMMISSQFGVCTSGDVPVGSAKVVSCDSDSLNYIPYLDQSCTTPVSPMSPIIEIPTDPEVLDCPSSPPYNLHFQALCLADGPEEDSGDLINTTIIRDGPGDKNET